MKKIISRLLNKNYTRKVVKSNEKIFTFDNTKLKYLFLPEKSSEYLIIVFSAFPSKNRPASYNYVKTFKNLKVNKLYILDDYGVDKRGNSYYLGENRKFFVKETVEKLIEHITIKTNIKKENMITLGTSKGGYAALYFAFSLGLGYSVVGAPQTMLGEYLSDYPKYFEYIAGGYSKDDKRFLNNILFSTIEDNKSNAPFIYYQISKTDLHHYYDHALPIFELFKNCDINFKKSIEEHGDHADVGSIFPKFSMYSIKEIIN